ALSTAWRAPVTRASSTVAAAPRTYASVTSLPSAATTRPSRPRSAAGRGVGKPPTVSGHTPITRNPSAKCMAFGDGLAPPRWLHGTPSRHADTTIAGLGPVRLLTGNEPTRGYANGGSPRHRARRGLGAPVPQRDRRIRVAHRRRRGR